MLGLAQILTSQKEEIGGNLGEAGRAGPLWGWENGTGRDTALGSSICGYGFRGVVATLFSFNVESIFLLVTKAALCLYHQP